MNVRWEGDVVYDVVMLRDIGFRRKGILLIKFRLI